MSAGRPDRSIAEGEELWETLEKLEAGALSDEEGRALDRLLGSSETARTSYLEYFELATLIEGVAAIRSEEGNLPVVSGSNSQKKALRVSVLAAAAVIALMAAIGAYISVNRAPTGFQNVQVAMGTEWSIDGVRPDSDGETGLISDGSTVKVTSGVVALMTRSGVRMLLQGPAEVVFPKPDEPELRGGWLWLDSSESDVMVRVRAKGLAITDIGTRFGVRAKSDGRVEVHLLSGLVEAESLSSGRKVLLGPEAKALMIPELGEPIELKTAADPFPGLDSLLEMPANYVTTVLGQAPSGYWRLNEGSLGPIENEVPGGSQGEHGPGAQPAAPGLRPGDGFGGFDAGNRAVYLPGEDPSSVLVELDAPEGVSRREGGVSFWFRKEGLPEEEEMLWYAGTQGGGLGPEDEMHAYLGKKGRVGFFMENGRYDILLSSGRNVADGKWHQVAASWGKNQVELFVDGVQVAEDSGARMVNDTVFSGLAVRFGKSRANHARLYQGWVDEIAYWNRPLTSQEIGLQYVSARAPRSMTGARTKNAE